MEKQLLKEAHDMLEKIAERQLYRTDEQVTRKQREDLMERINDYLLRE